eukprot:TRINITY_DN6604_c0_g1_i1.p1 TRINITY_DN6604_c0_g1~~TRINITY_DN6604_c0_g1_i1.p1  ORF type:complete len:398 (-),score=82.72 TRINITY_DN6604_c0_g1_i1:50-1243(-)
MEVDEEEMNCEVCGRRFDRKHLWKIHLKSVQHMERLSEVANRVSVMKEEQGIKELEEQRFSKLREEMKPWIEKYHEEMFKCLGILSPRTEPQSTNLTESIMNHLKYSRPRRLIQQKRKVLFSFISKIVSLVNPRAKLEVYGSIPHKLDSENSDIDVSLISPPDTDVQTLLSLINDYLTACQSPYLTNQLILTARIPVLNIHDTLIDIHLDLSAWHHDKEEIALIFTTYLACDPRVRPFLKAIRHWSKSRGINDAYTGTINSFGWTVIGLAYLQIHDVIPLLDSIFDEGTKETKENKEWKSKNEEDVGRLFFGFFEWILAFDYKTKRISIRHGGVTAKEEEKFEDGTVFCVERPRTAYQNVTRQVTVGTLKWIRREMHVALETLQAGGLLNDLCKKPK